MALQSMTGFARTTYQTDNYVLVWEARSVNGKGLDVRFRSTFALDAVEIALRKVVSQSITRGTIQITLTVVDEKASNTPIINKGFVKELLRLANELHEEYGIEKPTLDGIFSVKGIFENNEQITHSVESESSEKILFASFDKLLSDLTSSRALEGAALKSILLDQLNEIQKLVDSARQDPSRAVDAIKQRLKQNVSALMETGLPFDEERLHMEAVLLATKADIQEELDRLDGHINAATALLEADGPVGRKLDFLAQEFNREANTMCSKANASTVSAIGLALKAIIDQWREQVQNLE